MEESEDFDQVALNRYQYSWAHENAPDMIKMRNEAKTEYDQCRWDFEIQLRMTSATMSNAGFSSRGEALFYNINMTKNRQKSLKMKASNKQTRT